MKKIDYTEYNKIGNELTEEQKQRVKEIEIERANRKKEKNE